MKSGATSRPKLAIEEILNSDSAAWIGRAEEIGRSRQDRPILGFETGRGAARITLIGGCHADEPVGPALLELLAASLVDLPVDHPLLTDFTWRLVPHANPDGEARNRSWTERLVAVEDHRGAPDHGYDLGEYLRRAVREPPGDDIEFGFPEGRGSAANPVRPENRAVAEFLARATGPVTGRILLHGSFHGMGLSPGPWFLLERSWIERTARLRSRLAAGVAAMGYRLFDAERDGEKGFHRIGPGFTTRPDSGAMRDYFESRGEPEVARRFRPSSMEFARRHGNDPLTLVTEMPLFLIASLPAGPVGSEALGRARTELARAAAGTRGDLARIARDLEVAPMPVRDQMRLQLAFLDEALRTVHSAESLPGPRNGCTLPEPAT